jgi:serine/threonine protein kinase
MFCSRCGTEVQPSSRFCPTCGLDLTSVTQGALAGTAPLQAQTDDTTAVREALKDEYELEKELGRGGMAIVYKARDRALEREVAIKVLPFSLSFDAEFVERFQREARTSAKLEHPNIIPIYRVGKSGRVIYFVMKFIRGQTLSHVIETRGALPVPEIKRLLIEAGRALGYAHKHGIVHRDVKPDNIMFDELGQAIVTDFGIAKAQSGARLTGTGMSIGTPHYMSPEQARAQNLDGRSDIYSLGVVGYQCLTGHVPFNGEDSFSIGYKHIMEELPTPALETTEQRELFAVIQKMMGKKAEDRFQTAEELVAALEGSGGPIPTIGDLAAQPTLAIRPPTGATAMASAATTPLPRASGSVTRPSAAPPTSPPRPAAPPARPVRPRPVPRAKKSRAPLVLFLLLVVALGALGAYYFLVLRKSAGTQNAAASDSTANPQLLASADTAAGRRSDSVAAARRSDSVAAARRSDSATTERAESATAARRPSGAAAARARAPAPRTPQRERAKPPDVKPPPARPSTPARAQAATTTASGPPPPECERNPNLSVNNPNHVCWDTRPAPRSLPVVAVPTACGAGRPGPADILVHVSATGEVTGNPTAVRRSRCVQFDQAAMAYVLDLRFSPATKNGQPVATWTRVLIRPAR